MSGQMTSSELRKPTCSQQKLKIYYGHRQCYNPWRPSDSSPSWLYSCPKINQAERFTQARITKNLSPSLSVSEVTRKWLKLGEVDSDTTKAFVCCTQKVVCLEGGIICFVAVETNDKLDNLPKGVRAESKPRAQLGVELLSPNLPTDYNDSILNPYGGHTGEEGPMQDKVSGDITSSPMSFRYEGGWA